MSQFKDVDPQILFQTPASEENAVATRLRQGIDAMKAQAQKAINMPTEERDRIHKVQLGLAHERAKAMEQRAHQAEESARTFKRQRDQALVLLKDLVEGARSTDLDVPGYDEALAFFVLEKMLKNGLISGDMEIITEDNQPTFKKEP